MNVAVRVLRMIVQGICLTVWLSKPLVAQARPLTVQELSVIFLSGGDVAGWDEFDVPEFVAASYGSRAKQAILAILGQPSTYNNYYLQLEALTTAQYGRVDVPVGVLMEFASGAKGGNVGGVLRHRAMLALRMRADPSLTAFWLQTAHDPDASFRQLAAAGLACSLGDSAIAYLASLRADTNKAVARVADFYDREQRAKEPTALACGGRVTRSLSVSFPPSVRPELARRGASIRRRIP